MAASPSDFYTPKVLDAQLTGMIKTREPGLYSARLRIPSGVLTSEVLEQLAATAKKFGRGELYLTTRLGIEIPGVPAESFPALREELGAFGVPLAGCGPRMRSTVPCKGTVCPHGNLDTFALAWKVDQAYNDTTVLPHKFKVGIAGCPSSCSKPQTNDVGLVGVAKPHLHAVACVGCGVCKEACHLEAVELEGGLPMVASQRCVTCGDCVKACPAQAMGTARTGVDLYVGGRWGREKQVGIRIATFLTEEEAVGAVGRIKAWYADAGRGDGKKERLGQTIVRLGLVRFQHDVLTEIPTGKWVGATEEAQARFRPFR
ncbi:MAG: hypothetical protein HY900_05675 [Deltaproteobacteria bacterium]|nr:hypothetical protein [Deltaproteobacteria bacterium]